LWISVNVAAANFATSQIQKTLKNGCGAQKLKAGPPKDRQRPA